MKTFFYSKTFWSAITSVGIEVLTAYQAMPFISDTTAHTISLLLVLFIAFNRITKDFK
jgi:hypothetical protein